MKHDYTVRYFLNGSDTVDTQFEYTSQPLIPRIGETVYYPDGTPYVVTDIEYSLPEVNNDCMSDMIDIFLDEFEWVDNDEDCDETTCCGCCDYEDM